MYKQLLLAYVCLLSHVLAAETIDLMGSNGNQVAFAGVLKASPDGLTLLVNDNDQPIVVTWDKFDMENLRTNQPKIHQAMLSAINEKKEVDLRLGIYDGKATKEELFTELREKLRKTTIIHLPPMSVFFDDKDIEGGYFHFEHLDDFKFAEKRSNRYLTTYADLLKNYSHGSIRVFQSQRTHSQTQMGNVILSSQKLGPVDQASKRTQCAF